MSEEKNETPTATGESVATKMLETPCPKCGSSIKVLDVFPGADSKNTLLKCRMCGQEYRGHIETENEEPILKIDGPNKPKTRQVKTVEIVSTFGTDRLVGIGSFEELPDRVNVNGHFEEVEEVEKDGKVERKVKSIPASVSVPRSAIISVNKTYHD